MSEAKRLLLIVLAMILLGLCVAGLLWIGLMILPWIVGQRFSAIHWILNDAPSCCQALYLAGMPPAGTGPGSPLLH